MTSAAARTGSGEARSHVSAGPGAQDTTTTLAVTLDNVLPQPPTVEERELFLGPQHRWVPVLSFVGTMLTIISVLYFVGNQLWSAFLLVPLGAWVGNGLLGSTAQRSGSEALMC